MKLHIESPWSEDVRKYGAPLRAYLHTRSGIWRIGQQSQVYDRKTRTWTDRWAYITFLPHDHLGSPKGSRPRP